MVKSGCAVECVIDELFYRDPVQYANAKPGVGYRSGEGGRDLRSNDAAWDGCRGDELKCPGKDCPAWRYRICKKILRLRKH